MKPMASCALVDVAIDISWKTDAISHRAHYVAAQLNSWRDVFPGSPIEHLFKRNRHSPVTFLTKPGEIVPAHDPQKIIHVPRSGLVYPHRPESLKKGRFYPQGILSGLPGIFKDNSTPFRCIETHSKGIRADLNHPMAEHPMTLTLSVLQETCKTEERGGSCTDWIAQALSGPGMQTRYHQEATSFFSASSFDRRNQHPDTVFYATDRFVHHIDARARHNLTSVYQSLLKPGQKVLDLMAGWESHLPDELTSLQVQGIGLNENELKQNKRLDAFILQDLNTNGRLDFDDHMFDAVICSLSIEYLIHPVQIVTEVARILKPGGDFIVTFSNRWFPEKAIRIWEDLHDFERMGLVAEYFLQSGKFDTVSTLSMIGYPRPSSDSYYPEFKFSDPIYAVYGKK